MSWPFTTLVGLNYENMILAADQLIQSNVIAG